MKHVFTFLLWIAACSLLRSGSHAQSNHTILLDGANDFTAGEIFGAEAGRTGYLTWDATSVFIGIEGNPLINTNSNLYIVCDTDPVTNADPRTGPGRTDQPTSESGGATYPFSANIVYQIYGSGGDDGAALNPAPGTKFTSSGGAWSGAAIPGGVRIIRKGGSITEIEIPYSELGTTADADYNIFFYIANNSGGGSNYAQWPTGNADGNNPVLKHYLTENRSGGETPNVDGHRSFREDDPSGTFTTNFYGTLSLVPATTATYSAGPLNSIGFHLYIGPNATLNMGSNTDPLAANKDVTIDGALLLSNSPGADLRVGGVFSNSGTFTPNGRAVILNGLSPKTLNAAVATSFYDLTMANSGGVTLNNPVTVTNTLTLTSGKLTLGSNRLTIGSGGTTSGASSASYVVTDGAGSLTIQNVGATNKFFPVGTSTTYNPVTINNAGTIDNFSVRVQGSFDNPPNDLNLVLTRQWTISEEIAGGSNATISLQYNGTDPKGALFTYGGPSKFIGRYTGSQWAAKSATLTGSDPYLVTASGFTVFSPFGITEESSALPIQLSSFTGAYKNNRSAVLLNWSTLSEVNNYGFYVQKRSNGVFEWSDVANSFVAGHGTTNVPQRYTITDNVVAAGTWQYRLKQVDLDGTTRYSEPIQIDGLTDAQEIAPFVFRLMQNYPNPFNPSTEIKFSVETTGHAKLVVFNSLGENVATLFDDVAQAGQYYKVRFNASTLSSGVYFYQLRSGKGRELKKVVLLK